MIASFRSTLLCASHCGSQPTMQIRCTALWLMQASPSWRHRPMVPSAASSCSEILTAMPLPYTRREVRNMTRLSEGAICMIVLDGSLAISTG